MEPLTTFLEAEHTVGDSGYSTFDSEPFVQYEDSSENIDDSLQKLTLVDEKEDQIQISSSHVSTKEEEEEFLRPLRHAFTPDDDGDTFLHILPTQGMLIAMQQLIQYCPDSRLLDIQNKRKQAAIHVAAYLDLADEIKMLICKNARMDLVDSEGRNILHLCAEKGHIRSLMAILEICKTMNKMEVLMYLLQATNHSGCTPFYSAVINKRKEVLELLVNRIEQLDVNAVNMKNGNSPLHEAVMTENNADLVYFLLMYCKVDVNFQNNQNVTPLHIAACKGDEAICAILLRFEAQCDIEDDNGNIPAVYAANDRILQHLISQPIK